MKVLLDYKEEELYWWSRGQLGLYVVYLFMLFRVPRSLISISIWFLIHFSIEVIQLSSDVRYRGELIIVL